MNVTGFTRKFDKKVVRSKFLDQEIDRGKAPSSHEVSSLIELLEGSDVVLALTLAIQIGDRYVPYVMRSDGEWIWPGHLVEQMSKRNLELNEGFLEHVRSRQFRIQHLPKKDFDQVQRFIYEQMLL